jgi:hypothetical protein
MGYDQDDLNKAYGLEQSVNFISKSLSKNFNSSPDYCIGKESPAKYSFPLDDRFRSPKSVNSPGPNIYFYDKPDFYNRYRLNNLR